LRRPRWQIQVIDDDSLGNVAKRYEIGHTRAKTEGEDAKFHHRGRALAYESGREGLVRAVARCLHCPYKEIYA